MERKFLTSGEAASFLGVCKKTLLNWDSAKKIKSYRHPINGFRMYKLEDIKKIELRINHPEFY